MTWTRARRLVHHALVFLGLFAAGGLVVLGILATATRAQPDDDDGEQRGGLRDDAPQEPAEENRTQPSASQERDARNASGPARLDPPAPSSPGAPSPSGAESLPQASSNRLDVDVWIETWFSRAIDIHKVLPDGEREGQARVVRMYYNLSVEAYAKDTTRPFHYTIWVGDSKAMEGTATWKLHWVTSVEEDLFNISVEITQDGKTRRAEWARVLGIPGEDAGIGGHAGADGVGGPLTQEVPVGFINRLTWRLIIASLVQMVAAFVIVGGFFLERVERQGWQRFR